MTFLLTGRMVEVAEQRETKRVWERIAAVEKAETDLLLGASIFLLIGLLSHRVIDRVQALRRDVEALRHGVTRRAELPGPDDWLRRADIAMYDFGAGYSSLARLAELEPAALKIDGQFVRDFDGAGNRSAVTLCRVMASPS